MKQNKKRSKNNIKQRADSELASLTKIVYSYFLKGSEIQGDQPKCRLI